MSETVRILKRTILHHGFGLLEKVRVRRQRFDGQSQDIDRESYDTGHGAAILPYDPERQCVLLVRQFRLAAFLACGRETLIEACAGKLEGAEAASRIVMEAEEELGYAIRAPRFLFDAFTSPGVFTEKISFFVATYSPADKIGRGGGVDQDEDIEVLEIGFSAALKMIETNEIVDAKTILLLHYAKLMGLIDVSR